MPVLQNLNQGDQTISIELWLAAFACLLLMASTANAQVLSGVMTMTGTTMVPALLATAFGIPFGTLLLI